MPPKTSTRLGALSRPGRQSLHPRAFQLRCRRQQSNEPPKKEAPELEPMHRAQQEAPEPGSQAPPMDAASHNLLLMQIQAAQRASQARKLERPARSGQLKSNEKDASFHPALAGFVAGTMIAFGVSYAVYHFSGSYHVQKASQRLNQELTVEQQRIAAHANPAMPDDAELTADEITGWLRRASRYYSTFHPSSEKFVEARDSEITKGIGQSAAKAKEVEDIAKDCAVELQKEVGSTNRVQNALSGLATARTGWYIIMKHLLRIEEAVEGKEFVEKRRQRAAKGIIDE